MQFMTSRIRTARKSIICADSAALADRSLRIALECPEDIQTLFAMTPYSHRTPKIGLARLQALKELDVTLSFVILVFSAEETE